MAKKLVVSNSSLSTTASYESKETGLFVNVNYAKDPLSNKLLQLAASFYKDGAGGEYVGSYNADAQKSENLIHGFSNIKDLSIVDGMISCIGEIIAEISEEE